MNSTLDLYSVSNSYKYATSTGLSEMLNGCNQYKVTRFLNKESLTSNDKKVEEELKKILKKLNLM